MLNKICWFIYINEFVRIRKNNIRIEKNVSRWVFKRGNNELYLMRIKF